MVGYSGELASQTLATVRYFLTRDVGASSVCGAICFSSLPARPVAGPRQIAKGHSLHSRDASQNAKLPTSRHCDTTAYRDSPNSDLPI
jgi:hypothetical protein